jgi:hypothetical protein
MIGLDQTAVVYTPNLTTGAYDVVANAALDCRLTHSSISTDMGPAREEQTGARRMLWGPDYVMPETAQVEVDGVRWNVQAGTFAAIRGPDSAVFYRRCEVTQARS